MSFFSKKECVLKECYKGILSKSRILPMYAKEQLLRGVPGCLVNKEKRKGKGKKNLEEGENLSRKFSPSSRAFNVINLLLFFLTEERSRAFFV